jgi:hypothetical protein
LEEAVDVQYFVKRTRSDNENNEKPSILQKWNHFCERKKCGLHAIIINTIGSKERFALENVF